MYADDTQITYADSGLHLIQSSLSQCHDLEKLRKTACVEQTFLNLCWSAPGKD